MFSFKFSFGENKQPTFKEPPFSESFWQAANDNMLILLSIFALATIITGEMAEVGAAGWIEGTSILVSIFIIVMITSLNDWSKDKRYILHQTLANEPEVPVLRGKSHQTQQMVQWDLVVGDIVVLKAGDMVPADSVIIKSENLQVDKFHWYKTNPLKNLNITS